MQARAPGGDATIWSIVCCLWRHRVADAEPGGLEVGAFGGLEGDGMVGGGAGHRQELHAAASLAGGGSKQGLEVGSGKQARAGTGQEEAAGLDQAHAQHVKIKVLALAGGDLVAVGNELGRVEHDHAVAEP